MFMITTIIITIFITTITEIKRYNIGAGLVVAKIVGVEAFKNTDPIGSTLGNLASDINKNNKN